jgi:hypothetical protein
MSVIAPLTPSNFAIQQGNAQVLISWNVSAGSTSYNVSRSVDNILFSNVASVTTPFYLDTTVTPGTTYYYIVAAVAGSAVSPFTAALSITPLTTGLMSLGELRLAAQQRSDLVNSGFISTTEWNSYINQSYYELYDVLIQKYGNEYYMAPPLIIPTNGSFSYPLPNGINYNGAPPFYKLLGVDLGITAANNAWITLKKFEFIARNTYIYPQLQSNILGVSTPQYRVMGNNLEFIPTPVPNWPIQMWYIPRLPTLLQDSDACDGVSGWTEYIIIDAAIKALQKQEQDVTVLALQKQAMLARIEAAAENRDAGQPEVISSTRRWTDVWGMGLGDQPNGGN